MQALSRPIARSTSSWSPCCMVCLFPLATLEPPDLQSPPSSPSHETKPCSLGEEGVLFPGVVGQGGLMMHIGPQRRIDPTLIPGPLGFKPGDDIPIQAQG